MELILPAVEKLFFSKCKNEIWQYYAEPKIIKDMEIKSLNPFVITSGIVEYELTSKKEIAPRNPRQHILLASKIPKKKDFLTGKIQLIRWLAHPLFLDDTPEEICASWSNNFTFIKEDFAKSIKGLRPPQLGALHSLLAHQEANDEKAIVVMPTGTGKTETMLSFMIANQNSKILVVVPSDSLRTQLARKFITLGLLKDLKIIPESCHHPKVGILNSGFKEDGDFTEFVSSCNVVVSTMDLIANLPVEQLSNLDDQFTHLYVDEAHHSEAKTWRALIARFLPKKVTLFTATPFRNDGKKLDGKIIFNFSLKKAQEQQYYKKINFIPIREYDQEIADKKIAELAVEQLRNDRLLGYNHILMARCKSKERGMEIFRHYAEFSSYSPVLIYTGVSGLKEKIIAIKEKKHSIIVCVNMLGEGFDLPELKIAAVHDERQSLPITLQFIGRFTRTSYSELGEATFVTNIANPPIHHELEQLYSRNADWNILLPRFSSEATSSEIDFQNFISGFKNLDNSKIPYSQINPALSGMVYKNNALVWQPEITNWKDQLPNSANYDYIFSDHNSTDTLIIILAKISNVEWGVFETVQDLKWDLIVIHWDLTPTSNRVFINSSLKSYDGEKLLKAIFPDSDLSLINSNDVFRVFHDIFRLGLFNVGTRRKIGVDITFQSFIGRGVQDGLNAIEQGRLIKNNIFGVGFKEGVKTSIGCSVKGKIWSYRRGNLENLIIWFKEIGKILEDSSIDPNKVLEHALSFEHIHRRPNVFPIYIDWDESLYELSDDYYKFFIDGVVYDFWDVELNIYNPTIDKNIQFSLDTVDFSIIYELEITTNQAGDPTSTIKKKSPQVCTINHLNHNIPLEEFFSSKAPIIWFADESQLINTLYVKSREEIITIPADKIIPLTWDGVNLRHESQDIAPYIQDSIQYNFIKNILDSFDVIYDDDGPGEIADIIGIKNKDHTIEIHLYHLKNAKGGKVSNNIENFYHVCGQAHKSVKWKYQNSPKIFDRLFKRMTKNLKDQSCSRLIKGSEGELEDLLESYRFTKPVQYFINIVQPGLSKADASEDILLLLGNTYQFLHSTSNIPLLVYCSE